MLGLVADRAERTECASELVWSSDGKVAALPGFESGWSAGESLEPISDGCGEGTNIVFRTSLRPRGVPGFRL